MAEYPPDPTLGHVKRALRDAKDAWQSPPFIAVSGLAATAAAAASVLLPDDASRSLKVVLAVVSTAGAPFLLGLIVLLFMLCMAPARRNRDKLCKQIEDLESTAKLGEQAGTTIYAPNSTFILGDEGSVKEHLPKPEEKGG
jgi:hypothetical protein